MAQTIYTFLTEEPEQYSTLGQRRVCYINGYSWAIITRHDGIKLYRSSDKGQNWILKGTVLAHSSSLISLEASLHAIPSSNLFYWVAHVYKTGLVHAIYVGQVNLTDVNNPVIGSIIDVSSQTTTTGYYLPHITLSESGYFYLSYMTTRAGSSPYHQYYTLMSNNYTNWAGTVELNIGNSGTSVGRIVMERQRGANGLCVIYVSTSNPKYRYNVSGNVNGAGDWSIESNVAVITMIDPGSTHWLRYKIISIASRYTGEMWCVLGESGNLKAYYTSTYSGVWTLGKTIVALNIYSNSLCIRDYGNDELTDELLVIVYYTSGNVSYVYMSILLEADTDTIYQIGGANDKVVWTSSPEFVTYRPGGVACVFMETEPTFGTVYSGTWTSDIRNVLGVTSWGDLTIQNEHFPSSGHGSGQTYFVETRTGPISPPAGAWTATTEISPYTYQVNSVVNTYIQIRITYTTDPTLFDSLIPYTPVDNVSPLPIRLDYITPTKIEPVALMWYMRHGILRYETY